MSNWKVTTHEGNAEVVSVGSSCSRSDFDAGPLVEKGALVFQRYESGKGNKVVAIYAKDFWQKVEAEEDD